MSGYPDAHPKAPGTLPVRAAKTTPGSRIALGKIGARSSPPETAPAPSSRRRFALPSASPAAEWQPQLPLSLWEALRKAAPRRGGLRTTGRRGNCAGPWEPPRAGTAHLHGAAAVGVEAVRSRTLAIGSRITGNRSVNVVGLGQIAIAVEGG